MMKMTFDLVAHLYRQREWSEATFGPGNRDNGVIDHIRKELVEIEESPDDLSEWIDVVILALDGAWRNGFTPEQIADALEAKQAKNERRKWPDWRTAEPGKAIEHIRNGHE
jgi:dATP/dGTP pyrophosphohydrolase